MKVGIIGTAGRKEDADKLAPNGLEMFQMMCETADSIIMDMLKLRHADTHLISGGAAWADAVAPRLFKEGCCGALTLALPCEFDLKKHRFVDDGSVDWRKNPGGTSNYYHRLFREKTSINGLEEIAGAIEHNATVIVGKGLFDRNNIVAQADAMIAFTFGRGVELKDGGTKRTMNTYLNRFDKGRAKAFHVDLNIFGVFPIT